MSSISAAVGNSSFLTYSSTDSAAVICERVGSDARTLQFDSRSGPLFVARSAGDYVLDFPARPPSPADPSIAVAVAAALAKLTGAIWFDYLQLMTGSGVSRDGRQQEVSEISRMLKQLGRELSLPVIALAQLSRKVEERPDHKPRMSDLRESGAIEQDADMVCFIHRPEYYKIYTDEKGNDLHGMAEIIIAKHRNGAVGDVLLRFRGEYARFQNPDDDMIVPMPGEEKKAPVLRSKMNNGGGQDFVPPPPAEMPPMPDNPFGAPVLDVPF